MSKFRTTILRLVAAMLIAIGPGAGSMGIASAQEGGGPTTACGQTTDGGGDRADSVDCSGGGHSTSSGNTNGSGAGNGAGITPILDDDDLIPEASLIRASTATLLTILGGIAANERPKAHHGNQGRNTGDRWWGNA